MTLRYDLHCHSTYSDGLLKPADLVRRAGARGVDVLALTDHDETSGLAEARSAASDAGVRLIDGAELSVSWRDITLHVIALGIDPDCAALRDGLETIRAGRTHRAQRIGEEPRRRRHRRRIRRRDASSSPAPGSSAARILPASWSRPDMRATPGMFSGATSSAASPAMWRINGQRSRRRSNGSTSPAARRFSRTRDDIRSTETCANC